MTKALPGTRYTIVTSFETDTSQIQRYPVHTYIPGILMRVASVGCFPGAWRRGSWHFQVASLHLQSSMDFSLSASHCFSFLSKRSGRRRPPAERSALYILCLVGLPSVGDDPVQHASHSLWVGQQGCRFCFVPYLFVFWRSP